LTAESAALALSAFFAAAPEQQPDKE
jgi:hypothetical protein